MLSQTYRLQTKILSMKLPLCKNNLINKVLKINCSLTQLQKKITCPLFLYHRKCSAIAQVKLVTQRCACRIYLVHKKWL
jgi:hypothetical protein